jgi:transposase-like protein
MGTTTELEDLRRRIAGSPRNKQGHRQYDESLKQAVYEYARRRLRTGSESQHAIAGELGISPDTLWGLLHRAETRREKGLPERAREFRAAVAALGPRTRTTPYPPELRALGLAYLKSRQSAGASRREVASELGIGSDTLRKWSGQRRRRPASAVRQVSVVAAASPPVRPAAFVVHGPAGLRIEGMDVTTVVALLKGLS